MARLKITTTIPGRGEIVVGSFDPEKATRFDIGQRSFFKLKQGRWAMFENIDGKLLEGEYLEPDNVRQIMSDAGASDEDMESAFPPPSARGRKAIGPRITFTIPQDNYDRVSAYASSKDMDMPDAYRAVFAAGLKALKA